MIVNDNMENTTASCKTSSPLFTEFQEPRLFARSITFCRLTELNFLVSLITALKNNCITIRSEHY